MLSPLSYEALCSPPGCKRTRQRAAAILRALRCIDSCHLPRWVGESAFRLFPYRSE